MDLAEVAGWMPTLLGGLAVTLQLTAVVTILTVALAVVLAVAAMSPVRALRATSQTFVEVFRSIPLLAILYFTYYGLGPLAGAIGLSAFWLAVVALVFNESAYLGEVYRGALESVALSQWEAGSSLGLRWLAVVRLIVVPQAVLPAVPSTLVQIIWIIKNTSLASLVTIPEVTLRAQGIVYDTFQPIPVYLVLGAMYLALIVPLTIVARVAERRVTASRGQ